MRILRAFPLLAAITLAGSPPLMSACSESDSGGGTGGTGGGDGGPHANLSPVCRAVANACQPKDPGTAGEINRCHVTSMEGDDAACQELQDDGCIETCDTAPAVSTEHTMDHGDASMEHAMPDGSMEHAMPDGSMSMEGGS